MGGWLYDLVMDMERVPQWQLDAVATAVSPGDALRWLSPSGHPMFTAADAQYIDRAQMRTADPQGSG